jgi:hypothetical protein
MARNLCFQKVELKGTLHKAIGSLGYPNPTRNGLLIEPYDGLPSPGLSRCSGIGYTPVPGRTALPITDFTARMQDYE